MEIVTANCSSCGAPIKIPPDMDHFNCAFCGASLVIQRGEGFVALKLAEQVSRSIQDVGQQTQSTIRDGTQVTQMELKRLQIGQQISSLQIQLSGVQAEIRSLRRQKPDRKIKSQLKELDEEESSLINQIHDFQAAIKSTYPAASSSSVAMGRQEVPMAIKEKRASTGGFCAKPFAKGCLTSFLVLMVGAILCGLPAQALDQAIFKIPAGTSGTTGQESGPFISTAAFIIMILMFIGFVYGWNPRARLWLSIKSWVKGKVHIGRKEESISPEPTQTSKDVTPSE